MVSSKHHVQKIPYVEGGERIYFQSTSDIQNITMQICDEFGDTGY